MQPQPLTGKTALDVGCGAGLLAEPLARLGAKVTAIDASPEVIAVARDMPPGRDSTIDYRTGGPGARRAVRPITCMEVIEHVADPQSS